MRTVLDIALFAFVLMALPVTAQVTCTQLGAFTSCSGSGTQSTIQADLGNNMGVIIGPRTTTPYTVLPSTPRASSRSTAPTFLYGSEPTSVYDAPNVPSYAVPSVPMYDVPSYGYGQ